MAEDREEIEIERRSERQQMLEMDSRGRITIPSTIRNRYGIDPDDDDKQYWVEITIDSIEVDDSTGGDE